MEDTQNGFGFRLGVCMVRLVSFDVELCKRGGVAVRGLRQNLFVMSPAKRDCDPRGTVSKI